MTETHIYDGSPLSNAVDLIGEEPGWSSSGDYGQPGIGSCRIHDDAGALDIIGWRPFNVEESDCAVPRITTGFVYRRPIVRLNPYDGSRQWDTDVIDLNVLLQFRRIKRSDSSGKRPAETDLARLTWLLSTEYMTDVHADYPDGIVASAVTNLTDNPRNHGEADYRGQTPLDVLQDIAGVGGKRFGVRYDQATGKATLFYDLASSTIASSSLRISDDPADEDANTFAPEGDIELVRSPEDLFDAIHYAFTGREIYRTRPATYTDFRVHRDGSYSTSAVGKLTTADFQAQSWLDMHAGEIDTLKVTIEVPSSKVNLVREFDRIEFKARRMPGYESFQWLRVLHRTVGRIAPSRYRLVLELDVTTLHGEGNGGGGGGFPWVNDACDSSNVSLVQDDYHYVTGTGSGPWTYTKTNAWPAKPTAGSMLVLTWGSEAPQADASSLSMDGWTFHEQAVLATGNWISGWTKIAGSNESRDVSIVLDGVGFGGLTLRLQLQEWAGVDTVDDTNIEEDTTTAQGSVVVTLTPSADLAFVLLIGASCLDSQPTNLGTLPGGNPTLDDEVHPSTHETDNMLHWLVENPSGSYAIGTDRTTGTKGSMVGFALTCTSTAGPPLPGQDVPPLPPTGDVDGSNTDYVAPFPFADESLVFLHDGTDQTAHVTTYDGETGDFTLDYAPSAGSTLRVRLKGR